MRSSARSRSTASPTRRARGSLHRAGGRSRRGAADAGARRRTLRAAAAAPPPRRGRARAAAARTPAPDAAVMAAREAARSAASLDELRAILDGFEGCALRATATQLVFADGNPQARVMFVGEAPGREEDIEGVPFVGRSGKLLDRMLAAIGLDRTDAYIANIMPWRPPGNRTPTPQESAICLPFIARQIELADPDMLVCLGGPSTQTLLGIKEGISRTRGRWLAFDTGAAKSARWRRSTRPTCCASRCRSGSPGAISWRSNGQLAEPPAR